MTGAATAGAGRLWVGVLLGVLLAAGLGYALFERGRYSDGAYSDWKEAIAVVPGRDAAPSRSSSTAVAAATASARHDPLLEEMLSGAPPIIRQLHERMAQEPPFVGNADGIQSALAGEFTGVDEIGGAGDPLRVICVATMCEVAGHGIADRTGPGDDRILASLQRPAMKDSLAKWDFVEGPAAVGPSATSRSAFVLYLQRVGRR